MQLIIFVARILYYSTYLTGIAVGDCLRVLINLLKRNQSNQSLFIETGHLHRVVPLFEFLAPDSGASFASSRDDFPTTNHHQHMREADDDDEDDARGVPIHSFQQTGAPTKSAAMANGGGGGPAAGSAVAPVPLVAWPAQKACNVLLTLHAVRALLSPSNQENTLRTAQLAVYQCGACCSVTASVISSFERSKFEQSNWCSS